MIRKKYVVCVPLNDRGLKELENGDELLQNVKIYEFSEKEINAIFWLIHKFNEEFNILIDDYEEEFLDYDKITRAIQIVSEFYDKEDDIFTKTAVNKLLNAFILAESLNKGIEFDF